MQVKDKLWIWGHEAGSHNGDRWKIKGSSRMTPAEGAFYLGVPNMILVRYMNKQGLSLPARPFEQYARAFSPLKRVVWSIAGAGGVTEDDEVTVVCDLANQFPNICGVIMDDFFHLPDTNGDVGVFSPPQLKVIKEQLILSDRQLDLWVVLYHLDLDLPVGEHLKQSDVVTFWTWDPKEIKNLEQSLERAEKLASSSRLVLGCYMWDYNERKAMPISLMEKQCQLGLQWLQSGRIEGMIFLTSCICDLGLEAVEWTRQWIQRVGERELEE